MASERRPHAAGHEAVEQDLLRAAVAGPTPGQSKAGAARDVALAKIVYTHANS